MNDLHKIATPAQWRQVAQHATELAEKCAEVSDDVKRAIGNIPTLGEVAIAYYPEPAQHFVLISELPEENLRYTKNAMERMFGKDCAFYLPQSMWEDDEGEYIKVAYSPVIRGIGETMNLLPGKLFGTVPNFPGPVSSMLTSGLLGAGLGYGAGWLGEQAMPNDWRRGRLRKWMAALGGIAGAAPGLVYGLTNRVKGVPFNDNSTFDSPPTGGVDPPNKFPVPPLFQRAIAKLGADAGSSTGLDNLPSINVDKFNQTIWGDPYVAAQLPLPMQGAATSAVVSAQQMPGGAGPGWVTPSQMANLAAGMGAGYVVGGLTGGVLGLLTGLPDHAQDTLKRTGLWAGAISQVVPMLFGNR